MEELQIILALGAIQIEEVSGGCNFLPFDSYLMPRENDLLDRVGRATYATTLDLSKGYWQHSLPHSIRHVPVHSDDFGLTHSSSRLSVTKDHVLREVISR